MTTNISFILLFIASSLIIFPIFLARSKTKNILNEIFLNSLVVIGIILFLVSFDMHPPFEKSKLLINNKNITKNYTERLKNDAKTALITFELLKNKFLVKDTLYFKGKLNAENDIMFGVLTLISDSIGDSTIQIDYKANYSDKNGKIVRRGGNGIIQLKQLRIIFDKYRLGAIEINNFGKIVLRSENKDKWSYIEF